MRKLSIVLIILGVIIGVSPLVGRWYTRYQENRMMEEWLNSEDVSVLEEENEASNPEAGYSELMEAFSVESKPVESTVQPAATPVKKQAKPVSAVKHVDKEIKQTVIGVIQIDKIKLKAPVVEGVKAENLKAGIGHIPGTAALGQPGNCVLAGHRNHTFGIFFNRLDEMEEGDEIIIITKKEELKYKVYKKHVVTPDDVSVLKGSKDDNIITLVTCTPIYVATHRLILNARLEERVLKEP